jgi:AcrR family transcriptional regulator
MEQPGDTSTTPSVGATGHRRKVGRPPRIDRAMIARAAYEIGLDRVTMKAVAERLGVSVPGLYHHIQGREDLMRLGAEYSAAQIQVPVDHGQHWTAWLLEWAEYSHDAFVAQPALLGQFLNGSLGVERMVTHVDAVVGVLTRQGFTPAEAVDAYDLVSECALGAAVSEIRFGEAARSGRPVLAEYHRVLATEPPDAFPHLRTLVSSLDGRPGSFVDHVVTVLVGIAIRRGEDWRSILDLAGGRDDEPFRPLLHP